MMMKVFFSIFALITCSSGFFLGGLSGNSGGAQHVLPPPQRHLVKIISEKPHHRAPSNLVIRVIHQGLILPTQPQQLVPPRVLTVIHEHHTNHVPQNLPYSAGISQRYGLNSLNNLGQSAPVGQVPLGQGALVPVPLGPAQLTPLISSPSDFSPNHGYSYSAPSHAHHNGADHGYSYSRGG